MVIRRLYFPYAGSSGRSSDDGLSTLAELRNSIDTWWDELTADHIIQRHPYLEVNYHLLLIRLYSPSPAVPHTPACRMPSIRYSAWRVIELYGEGGQDYKVRRNHVTFAHIVFACVALLYSLAEGEGDRSNLDLWRWRRLALRQISAAELLLKSFCPRPESSQRYFDAYATLTADLKTRLNPTEGEEARPSWAKRRLDQSGATDTSPTQGGLELIATESILLELNGLDGFATGPDPHAEAGVSFDGIFDGFDLSSFVV